MFTHIGAVRLERQFDFLPRLQHEKGMVANPEVAEVFPDDRSELSFAITPASFVPNLDHEVCVPAESEVQAAEADLLLLAADGFGISV